MKILHTSDWHLGKRLDIYDRITEQTLALNWLRTTIAAENIEALIVAGDVFDTTNPPNEARRLYYQFLSSLLGTSCRHVVIVGGNHDSAAMLGADKDLLEALQIYVVGGAQTPLNDEVLLLRNAQNEVELIVAAVPFLRDADLRQTNIYDTIESRYANIQAGIKAHYAQIGEIVTPLKAQYKVPVVATGHLFARNATDDKEKGSRIYVGNLENIDAADFPSVFDYIALGHIHKAQSLLPNIRYSGSLLPLSFSEIKNEKTVFIIETSDCSTVKTLALPVFRKLVQLKGTWEQLQTELSALQTAETGLDSWAELLIESNTPIPNISADIHTFIETLPLKIIKFSVLLAHKNTESINDFAGQTLASLDIEDVFLKRCASASYNAAETTELRQTFLELLGLVHDD